MTAMPMSRAADAAFHEELERLKRRALKLIPASRDRTAQLTTVRPGLFVLRHHTPTVFEATIYDPMLCLILEGRKEMTFDGRNHRLGTGECALISHDLPIESRVREAPYLVVLIGVDVDVLRGLDEDVDRSVIAADGRALEVHRADARLLDAVGRYLAIAESSEERVLGPMVQKEIHYRLLVSPLGPMLRNMLQHDSHASSIARAIALLRRDFRSPMVVEDLARSVGMSVSSFHKHFKNITSSSPLQYQKGLRLLEARRQLVAGTASVTTVAFDVGYESPAQFSREYTRKFGRPPKSDAEIARAARA